MYLKNGVLLENFKKPYIVAELNTSHFGNLDTAKEMIRLAKEMGCDCVKFQSWSEESLYAEDYYRQNPMAKRMFRKLSFDNAQLKELACYAQKIDISFASTPYSKAEVDFLIRECDVPFIKVASMDLNNYAYLHYIASTGVPMVLSTGMGELHEIQKAVSVIKSAGNQNLCILHCTSVYPAAPEFLQLRNIIGLQKAFPDCAIGYSDHSLGSEIACAAVAMGACLIEKHFTLDNKKIGMDNQMAMEPQEMASLIAQCHNVYLAMGGESRVLFSEEEAQRKKMRRSIVTMRSLEAGTTIVAEDLDCKRPGVGLPPERLADVIGKVLRHTVEKGSLIQESDF